MEKVQKVQLNITNKTMEGFKENSLNYTSKK